MPVADIGHDLTIWSRSQIHDGTALTGFTKSRSQCLFLETVRGIGAGVGGSGRREREGGSCNVAQPLGHGMRRLSAGVGGGREVVWWLVRVRAGMVRSAFVLGHGCHYSLDPLCMRTCPLYIVNAPSAALCIDSV